jgi:hypothetical protein
MTSVTLFSDLQAELLCGGSPSHGGFSPLQGAQFGNPNVSVAVALFGAQAAAISQNQVVNIRGGGDSAAALESSSSITQTRGGYGNGKSPALFSRYSR